MLLHTQHAALTRSSISQSLLAEARSAAIGALERVTGDDSEHGHSSNGASGTGNGAAPEEQQQQQQQSQTTSGM